jgi:hypothetical protein
MRPAAPRTRAGETGIAGTGRSSARSGRGLRVGRHRFAGVQAGKDLDPVAIGAAQPHLAQQRAAAGVERFQQAVDPEAPGCEPGRLSTDPLLGVQARTAAG